MKKVTYIFAGVIMMLLTACSQEPADIHYGGDECTHCKMMITDDRFASQIVTKTGKSIKFDSIECMATYAGDHKAELKSAKYWVSNFSNPGNWIDIQHAFIVRSEVINSPMGASLLAIDSQKSLVQHLAEYPGKTESWKQLVK